MREITRAIEASWASEEWGVPPKGEGWKGLALELGASRQSLFKWRREGFPGRVLPALVRVTGVRGRPVLLELVQALDIPPQYLAACIAECTQWPEMGEWVRLMASRALECSPEDVTLLFDATRETPAGVLPGQLGLSDAS